MLLLVNLIHSSFETDEINIRLCKNIAFCLSKVFEITTLKESIDPVVIQQLLYELVTHLSNGIGEQSLEQWMRNVVGKLIEDCTIATFVGLLSLIGDFENRVQFTEKWVKLALKCFEQCGLRICESGLDGRFDKALFALEKFLQQITFETLQQSPIGSRIIVSFRTFTGKVLEKFPEILKVVDVRIKFPGIVRLLAVPEIKKNPLDSSPSGSPDFGNNKK
jgi:hypothetical protein